MLPTPSTSHVSFNTIYDPAEDSFLFLDTLSSPIETAWLTQRFDSDRRKDASPTPLIVEVGTGSGVILAFLTANAEVIFGRKDILTLGTDVNSNACRATRETIHHATHGSHSPSRYLGSITSDLCASLRNQSVDVLVFNPPYVPTPELPEIPKHPPAGSSTSSFDESSHLLSLSYAGGTDGMETTARLLKQLPDILNPGRGVAYILLCAQNKPEQMKECIRSWGSGWMVETVSQSGKSAGWEKLQIIRIWREAEHHE